MVKIGIWGKLLIFVMAVGMLAIGSTAYLSYQKAKRALENVVHAQLVSIRDIKRNQIEKYFLEKLSGTEVMAGDILTIRSLQELSNLKSGDVVSVEIKKSMKRLESDWQSKATLTKEKMGFYDIFIIDSEGNILQTVAKEDDLGTNLIRGKYKNSSLASAFRRGMIGPSISDIEYYEPSQEKISAFFSAPVKDKEGAVLGVLATQIIMNEIDEIMQNRSGLGKTGESILIGSDLLLRSNSRFFEETTVLKRKIDREGPRRAIAGKTGTMWLRDYRDVPVLNAYTPVDIPGLNWGLIAKMDEDEVLAPVYLLRRQVMLLSVLVAAFILMTSYIFAKKLTSPISALDNKLLEMSASGRYGGKLPIPSRDEIGSLVKSFNEMSSTIKMQTDGLEKANSEMESFIYSVSHDLKSPLITIRGMMELTRKELDRDMSEEVKTYFSHIDNSAMMMNDLLEDLLEISRVGRMDVEPVTVEIGEIVDEVVTEAKVLAKERDFDFQIMPGIPAGRINKKRLYQVISNLVVNAVKFMPGDVEKPVIEIGGSKLNNYMVEFYVKDNGKGIDSKDHQRIFRIFERLESREVPGTGMGLAYVKKIIESVGGSIRVESSPGKGATFFITFPAAHMNI